MPASLPDTSPSTDQRLAALVIGDRVACDGRIWQVTALARCDFEDHRTRRWRLDADLQTRWLELELGEGAEDEPYWSLSQPVSLPSLTGETPTCSPDAPGPPETLTHSGGVFLLEDQTTGRLTLDALGAAVQPTPFRQWHYVDRPGERFLRVELHGARGLEMLLGREVLASQFTILARGET